MKVTLFEEIKSNLWENFISLKDDLWYYLVTGGVTNIFIWLSYFYISFIRQQRLVICVRDWKGVHL